MTFAKLVLDYYEKIQVPKNLPRDVGVLNPFKNDHTKELARAFYDKYYGDKKKRFICFGINPGRFGAGVTGVPFTDPIRLKSVCGIDNQLDQKQELSSKFIYEMIDEFGGPRLFYNKFYISAVSPLGYVKDGLNLNYYDIPDFKKYFEQYAVDEIHKQFKFGLHRSKAFSIGKGKNIKFLLELNKKHHLFEEIVPLSHPRWVMQYRLKRKTEFIEEYLQAFEGL